MDQLSQMLQAAVGLEDEKKKSNTPGLDCAITLPEAFNKYEELGMELEPQLLADGSHFSNWEAALEYAVTTEFKVKDHFVQPELGQSGDRADLTGVFIEHSIHISLLWSVRGKNGRMAFKVLQARFAPTAFQEAETRLDKIEKRTGKLTKDTGLALVVASARTVSCQYLHLGRMRAIMCCSSLGATRCVTNNQVGFP
ncbi:hypothetical protein PGT21_007533 [Puccinia graminis f. sp. tritici]|uniref:Uncharacterized protein n=1 Tax=Puccinia graminis f. sp. tritici TaxID=56615 RepID=A0A5B0RC62_PUCGR|nr:hypothetical protein PGT21_007533 [Puccinia graminis f. sp. tritici]KAA1122949.1 hypothetical protein PGTUg99_005905 [Puccinia graminis f. sp. tritici]